MTTRDDRIKGTAAGQAIGDALGAPVEFGPAGSVAAFGRGVFGHPAGSWTDDTEQLTVVLTARSDPDQVAAGLENRGIDLVLLEQPIDTRDPLGRMLFRILAAVAEFERSLIIERN